MVDDFVVNNGLKLLACIFLNDVLCSYRKDVGFRIMARCSRCPSYKKFELLMAADDEAEAVFLDEVRKHPERYGSGA